MFARLRSFLNACFRRDRFEAGMEHELRFHMDAYVADLTRAGLPRSEALRRARLEFGAVETIKEECRQSRGLGLLDEARQDLRYALRSLTKNWTFSLGAGAVLALGIGANVAMFSVVNTILLQPLDYPDADRIVSIEMVRTDAGISSRGVSGADFLDWQAQNSVFEAMAYSVDADGLATVASGQAEFVNARRTSPDFFAVFGQSPAAGRLLTSEDADAPVVVVSYRWAVSRFSSAHGAIGQPLTVYGRVLEIVGVAAPGFEEPGAAEIWVMAAPPASTNRGPGNLHVVAKLEPGVEFGAAQVQMRTISDRLAAQFPENRFQTATVISLQDHLTGTVRLTLWVLMGASLVVLLIGCANIANLLLARAVSRTREMALRAALGAGRGRVVRQLLTESLALAVLAAGFGLLMAYVFLQGLVALSPVDLPRVEDVSIDMTVLLFSLGLSLVSTLLFGLAPAFQAARVDLSEAFKLGGSKGRLSGGSGRWQSTLVIVEVTLSIVLLVAAGLLLRTFQVLHEVPLGFDTDRVLVAYTNYPATNDEAYDRRRAFYLDFLARVRTLPGVSAAAGVDFLPLGRDELPRVEYLVEGEPEERPGERPTAEYQAITPEYFQTLRIPILLGRDFAETDTEDKPGIAIINESLARAAFPSESPIGRRMQVDGGWMEIVGVVGDTRWTDPKKPAPPMIFTSATQGFGGSLSILTRTPADDGALANTLRTMVHETEPTVPVRFETMKGLFAEALAYPRFRSQLLGAFAGIAALLAASGIFSVLAYFVGQRTGEMAVRRAMGAQPSDLVGLVAGQGLRLVAIGIVLGLAGAFAVTRLLQGFLYEVSPFDVRAYVGAITLLGLAATLAIVLPVIQAVRIEPLKALREE